jgi:hypothetical protein
VSRSVALIAAAATWFAVLVAGGCGDQAPKRTHASQTAIVSPATSAPTCDLSATASTFASQVAAATPGQTICLAAGTYRSWSGASKPAPGITITAAPGAGVTLPIGSSDSNEWNLGSIGNFTIDGTADGGSITIPAAQYEWTGSTTTALNITIQNVMFAPNADLDISSPTNSNILINHVSWNSSDCLVNEGIRLHLSYSNNTESGVTVENSEFIGGSSDGIQTGDPMRIIDNYFQGVIEKPSEQSACHTDSVQLVGAAGVATVIKGNWFAPGNADGIGGWDGPLLTDIENNVIAHTSEEMAIDLDEDRGSTIMHNTIIDPANGIGIDLGSKTGQIASTGTIIRDNIIDRASTPESLTGPGNTATPAVNTNNMFSSRASSPNFNGTPILSGGKTFTAHNSYLLTAGSAGHNRASDGTAVGIYAIGNVTYGPQ